MILAAEDSAIEGKQTGDSPSTLEMEPRSGACQTGAVSCSCHSSSKGLDSEERMMGIWEAEIGKPPVAPDPMS